MSSYKVFEKQSTAFNAGLIKKKKKRKKEKTRKLVWKIFSKRRGVFWSKLKLAFPTFISPFVCIIICGNI